MYVPLRQEVNNVVNYDAPMYAKTYVHRVGRTARAGATGRAFTLLCPQEAVHFKRMLGKVGGGAVQADAGQVQHQTVANRDFKVWHGATENGP